MSLHIEYSPRWILGMDLKILLETAGAVLPWSRE
jgi:hypothetical protein